MQQSKSLIDFLFFRTIKISLTELRLGLFMWENLDFGWSVLRTSVAIVVCAGDLG